MGTYLSVKGFASKDNEEYKRHFEVVKVCIKNKVSFPKETSDFFKGKIGGDDLEDIVPDAILEYLKEGIEIDIPLVGDSEWGHVIKVSDIPKEVDRIIVELK